MHTAKSTWLGNTDNIFPFKLSWNNVAQQVEKFCCMYHHPCCKVKQHVAQRRNVFDFMQYVGTYNTVVQQYFLTCNAT